VKGPHGKVSLHRSLRVELELLHLSGASVDFAPEVVVRVELHCDADSAAAAAAAAGPFARGPGPTLKQSEFVVPVSPSLTLVLDSLRIREDSDRPPSASLSLVFSLPSYPFVQAVHSMPFGAGFEQFQSVMFTPQKLQ
jgi:hypothetical protein